MYLTSIRDWYSWEVATMDGEGEGEGKGEGEERIHYYLKIFGVARFYQEISLLRLAEGHSHWSRVLP